MPLQETCRLIIGLLAREMVKEEEKVGEARKNNLDKKYFYFFVILAIFGIARFFRSASSGEWNDLYWFCVINLFILVIALYKKSNLLISSVLVSSLISGIIYTIDILSFTFNRSLIFGTTEHLFDIGAFGLIVTYYHVLLWTVPLYFVLKEKKFHRKAWILSSVLYLVLSTLSLLTGSNVNGIREGYTLGVFDFLYVLRPAALPLFIFNWLFITIVLFLPAHLLFRRFSKK